MSAGMSGDDRGLTDADREQLRERGIEPAEAERQLALLRDPPAPAALVRPCTPGDGLRVLDDAERSRLANRWEQAAAEGRVSLFVPASGAASRMFRALTSVLAGAGDGPIERGELERAAAGGDSDARAALDFVAGLDDMALAGELRDALAVAGRPGIDEQREHGDYRPLLETLLGTGAGELAYGDRPKGLIPFHRYPGSPEGGGEARTPFEEHLVEAAGHARDADGRCRLHFTVAPEHEAGFRELLAGAAPRIGGRTGISFEVGFSHQSPATDTVAIDPEGHPFRLDDGTLLLRPGGHGALLGNLGRRAEEDADLVVLKNIDNVVPDRLRAPVIAWKKALGGLLVELQERIHGLLERLETDRGRSAEPDAEPDPGLLAEAERFCADELGRPLPPAPPPARREAAIERLDRPLRICGMVPNEGEPGGGPFWVAGRDGGVSRQIVEKAEVDLDDPEQEAILAAATHFNPVDVLCALRDRRGRPYDLDRFADPEAVFVAKKSHAGRPLTALERPGLWNGAMARWNTVFVEVPAETFAPVKTVLDLLRPAHRADD